MWETAQGVTECVRRVLYGGSPIVLYGGYGEVG